MKKFFLPRAINNITNIKWIRRWFLFTVIFIFAATLSACGCSKRQPMDKILEEQGGYYYQNKNLGFALILPAEFKYYQTQRKETSDYIDIEYFVPTSDIERHLEVPGYDKPIVIRIFKQDDWQNILNEKEKAIYQKVGEKGSKVYTIKFWQDIPADWVDLWSEGMKQKIISSIEIN